MGADFGVGSSGLWQPQPPKAHGDVDGTTGSYVVLFHESGDYSGARAALNDLMGVRELVSSEDLGEAPSRSEEFSDQSVYFETLGVAVVEGDADRLAAMSVGDDLPDGLHSVVPEPYVYPLDSQGSQNGYVAGYRDGVNDLADRLLGDPPESEMVAVDFVDDEEVTWGLRAIGAHTSSLTGRGVKVAVLDTGLDLEHPDFKHRPIKHASFVPRQAVQDGSGHGTHCVGTVCGPRSATSDGPGYGVAPEVELYVGKVLPNYGSGRWKWLGSGLEWANRQGCQIISMSLGGGGDRKLSARLREVYNRLFEQGVLLIAAAGNNADRAAGDYGFVEAPANSESMMAVGALDRSLQVANFSARSSTKTGSGGKVDIAAPGVAVYSSIPTRFGGYERKDGTSMATPHVAGVAALMAQAYDERGAALWNRLERTARPLMQPVVDVGSGLVQAPQ